LIKALTAFELGHDEVEMIEQTPTMKFHGLDLAVEREPRIQTHR
jgi:hypothetical protein